MSHGDHLRNRRRATAAMASARETLCRLSASNPWLWLVRSCAFETSATIPLVLFHELPRLLVAFGEGALGHG